MPCGRPQQHMKPAATELQSGAITACIGRWREGEPDGFQELLGLVMQDLRRLAKHYFRNERNNVQIQTTLLINDVCLELGTVTPQWTSREEFFGFAGYLMRRLLIQYRREQDALKRGGRVEIVPLTREAWSAPAAELPAETLLSLGEALDRLTLIDPEARTLIELRFLFGFTVPELVTKLGWSRATVNRKLRAALHWLATQLENKVSSLGGGDESDSVEGD